MIAASDRDAGAIEAARRNAERAGVAAAIDFQCSAITAQPWLQAGASPPRGVLASNPPFGLRVPKGDRLLPLYQTLGHRALALGSGWRVALLAHDVRLARRTGLPLRAAWTTRHGGLSVTALTGAVVAAAT
jgi:23S rRNA G2445 N2-methylase RlmL